MKKDSKKDKVWLCRGCCCGTVKKHPGVDHKGQVKQVRKGAKQLGAGFEVTDCLGPCGQGNIVVTRREGVIEWFRKINDSGTTAEVLSRLGGAAPDLDLHRMPKRTGKKPKH